MHASLVPLAARPDAQRCLSGNACIVKWSPPREVDTAKRADGAPRSIYLAVSPDDEVRIACLPMLSQLISPLHRYTSYEHTSSSQNGQNSPRDDVVPFQE